MATLKHLFDNNEKWAAKVMREDSSFFKRLADF